MRNSVPTSPNKKRRGKIELPKLNHQQQVFADRLAQIKREAKKANAIKFGKTKQIN
jgi:hypothetical protein